MHLQNTPCGDRFVCPTLILPKPSPNPCPHDCGASKPEAHSPQSKMGADNNFVSRIQILSARSLRFLACVRLEQVGRGLSMGLGTKEVSHDVS